MSHEERLRTLHLLVNGDDTIINSNEKGGLDTEWANLFRLQPGTNDDERLLTVIHTTRLLDTYLKVIVFAHGWSRDADGKIARGMGDYLYRLVNQAGLINHTERNRAQQDVVNKRNMFMHTAGAIPDSEGVNSLLSAMHACMFLVNAALREAESSPGDED